MCFEVGIASTTYITEQFFFFILYLSFFSGSFAGLLSVCNQYWRSFSANMGVEPKEGGIILLVLMHEKYENECRCLCQHYREVWLKRCFHVVHDDNNNNKRHLWLLICISNKRHSQHWSPLILFTTSNTCYNISTLLFFLQNSSNKGISWTFKQWLLLKIVKILIKNVIHWSI